MATGNNKQQTKQTSTQPSTTTEPVVDNVETLRLADANETAQSSFPQTDIAGQSGTVVQTSVGTIAQVVVKEAPDEKQVLSAMSDIVNYNLNQYVQKMRPGIEMTSVQGALFQKSLWRSLQTMIEKSTDEEFAAVYSSALAIFKENAAGAFNDLYVMRFMSDVQLDKDEIFAFQAIVNLMNKTADAAQRATMLRQVDMSRTLSRSFSESGRQRVLAYYNM